jgi:Na+:H+ antiporter
MAPKGLGAAVLASVPLQAGIAGGVIIRDQTYFVVLISILLTATMLPSIDRGMLKGCQQPSQAA